MARKIGIMCLVAIGVTFALSMVTTALGDTHMAAVFAGMFASAWMVFLCSLPYAEGEQRDGGREWEPQPPPPPPPAVRVQKPARQPQHTTVNVYVAGDVHVHAPAIERNGERPAVRVISQVGRAALPAPAEVDSLVLPARPARVEVRRD